MSMGVYNIVGLWCNGKFYMGVISQYNQQWVSKGSVCICIPIIVRLITIWDELFFKLRVPFDGMLIKKKVLLEYTLTSTIIVTSINLQLTLLCVVFR